MYRCIVVLQELWTVWLAVCINGQCMYLDGDSRVKKEIRRKRIKLYVCVVLGLFIAEWKCSCRKWLMGRMYRTQGGDASKV